MHTTRYDSLCGSRKWVFFIAPSFIVCICGFKYFRTKKSLDLDSFASQTSQHIASDFWQVQRTKLAGVFNFWTAWGWDLRLPVNHFHNLVYYVLQFLDHSLLTGLQLYKLSSWSARFAFMGLELTFTIIWASPSIPGMLWLLLCRFNISWSSSRTTSG